MEYEGDTYSFCSGACRDAMTESDRVFTEYRGYRRFYPGVAALDRSLPQGMLRNSFVLFSGQAGTRDAAVHAELVWRALQRGEPAVVLSFQEPPVSVVERFLTLDWNVLPYLERDQLHVVDAFTYRLDDPDRMRERMNDWNQHLQRVVDGASTAVRDASDVRELANKVDACLDAHGMVDTGVVLIDSLTELGSLVQPVQAYNFVKDLRADVCKGRFVPIFAGATFGGKADAFPHDLDYTVDGVVDMQLNDDLVEDTLIKRVRIRKMNGVLTIPEWTAYEYTAGQGMVPFDPEVQMEKKRVERVDEGEEAPADDAEVSDAEAAGAADDADDAESAEADGTTASAAEGEDSGDEDRGSVDDPPPGGEESGTAADDGG